MEFFKFILIFLALNLFLFALKSLDFLFSSSQFDQNKAKEFWYFSIAAYCSPNNVQSWSVSTVSNLYPNVQDIVVFSSSGGENFGYSAYERNSNLIFVSIRGSANFQNWLQNLNAFQTNYNKCNGCNVHEGFYNAYSSLKEGILSSIQNLHRKYPTAQIAVLGHSLGAAIATFAYIDLFQIIGNIDYFYTFGSPRVGNQNFADFVNSKTNFGGNFRARVTHYRDPVPHVPMHSVGFAHIDTEVFYVQDSSSYTICQSGEDPNCSLQYIIPNLSDHSDYMGFPNSDLSNKC